MFLKVHTLKVHTMLTEKPRSNLINVAHRAGVSPATVSRVLNSTAPVRSSVRERVLAAVSELGYQHPVSHVIAPTRQNSIAVLIPDILNPYLTEIARGIQNEASVDRLLPLILDTNEDPQREHQFLRMFAAQPVCGIILCGSRIPSQELIGLRSSIHTPMVVLNRNLKLPNVACIVVDLKNATYRATRHLLDLNHTRIAFLNGPGKSETTQLRQSGVEWALSEAGLDFRPEWHPSSFPDVDGGFQAMSALLTLPSDTRPTAVVAYNDLMALGALHAIRAHGLHVPEDISVIGMDDIAMASHANPPLTSLATPKHRMGRLAVQILRRMINGQAPPEEGYTLVESRLIVRESTAPAPRQNEPSSIRKAGS